MSTQEKPWVDGLTYAQTLAHTVDRYGDHDAVVFPKLGLRWTYREFEQEVKRLARAMLAVGIQPGDHVGIWSTNWPQFILAQFSTGMIGAVLVNVNPAYRVHEFSYVLKQADIALLLATDSFKTSNYELMIAKSIDDLEGISYGRPIQSDKFPKLRHVVSIKNESSIPAIWPWRKFLEQAEQVPQSRVEELSAKVRPQTPVNIQYTSGTTGNPKGATLSHRNLLMNAYYVGSRMNFSDKDRLNIPVPFYHCFGSVMGTLMCSLYGAAMVVPSETFKTEDTLAALHVERCTGLYGVPTMFNAELHNENFDQYDLKSLRTGIMAGSPCPMDLMRNVMDRMNLSEITIAYGLTEASPVITQSDRSESIDIRVSTVGKPLPGLEVRIVDPGSGEDLPEGEQGELWVRGHGVMLGYYNMPEATEASITDDGWLRSGDLARCMPSGHYQITGRIKDMLIRGGENIYPREIEEFLHTHPKIRDVQVVGVPDEHFGEQVMAWIIPTEPDTLTANEVRQFCKGNIAHYKIPHYIEFVDHYPLTVTGKVQKFRLREMASEMYGLNNDSSLFEIRWHGRGGQGVVTAANLLVDAAHLHEGYSGVAACPSFGAERRGAPISASTRIASKPILRRGQVTSPDIVVVLDETLLDIVDVKEGLRPGGTVVINTANDQVAKRFDRSLRVAWADASGVAREMNLVAAGSVVVNTAILGTLCCATGIVKIENIARAIRTYFGDGKGEHNAEAARMAYERTTVREPEGN